MVYDLSMNHQKHVQSPVVVMKEKGFPYSGFVVAIILIVVAFSSRLLLDEYPNFKPIAAIALFAGFYFRNIVFAVSVPVAAMLASDGILGGYEWQIALAVYGCFVASVFFGRHVISSNNGQPRGNSKQIDSMRTSAVIAAPWITATVFFVVTNLATWLFSNWYELSLSGLTSCFVAAIPFYKYTLAGDLIFTWSLFGMYVLVSHFARRVAARRHAMV